MNTLGRAFGQFNSINREIALIISIGFVIAITVVTTSIVVINQF